MSRKLREIKKVFKIFCEGDSEYNYFDSMKRERKLSLAIKLVNMKGGGYGNFLEKIREDGNTNCLAKFITKTSHTSNGNCSLKIQQYRQSDNKLSPCSRSG